MYVGSGVVRGRSWRTLKRPLPLPPPPLHFAEFFCKSRTTKETLYSRWRKCANPKNLHDINLSHNLIPHLPVLAQALLDCASIIFDTVQKTRIILAFFFHESSTASIISIFSVFWREHYQSQDFCGLEDWLFSGFVDGPAGLFTI